jgi:hypothetical protein
MSGIAGWCRRSFVLELAGLPFDKGTGFETHNKKTGEV